MGKLAEAYVDVGANLGPLNAGLARAKSSLKSFALKGGAIALGALGVGGIGAAMMAAAKKASDLGETLSKVGVSFGPAAKGVIDQSDRLAEKFGVVKKESLDAAAAFGLMGQAAGLSKIQSAGLASEMVQLGLDIASFHNLSNAEAFEKLRSGLSGEAEPLRPLGILLSEDAVKAQALAMGLTKVKRELTEQEKVLARLSLIKKQAGPAVGDLERTKDSTANQMKKLEGELENAATAFGMGLQDALGDAIKLAHELGDAIKAATGKDVATNVGELARAGVSLGRTAVAGGPGGLARLLGASGDAAVAEGFGRMAADAGLKGVAGKAQDAGNLKRQGMEAQIAAAAGFALEAAPTRPGQGTRLPDAAQQRQKQLDALAASRKAADDKKAAGEAQAKAFREKADQKNRMSKLRAGLGGLVRGLGTNLGGNLGAIAGAFQPGQGGAFGAMNKFRANQLPGLGLGAGGGMLARGAMMLGHNVMRAGQERIEKGPFQSEHFGSASEFASSAIQKALSEDDTREKQLKQLEEANQKLDDIKQKGGSLLDMLAKRPVLGAILRGAS